MPSFWKLVSYTGLFLGFLFTVWVLSKRKRSPAATWAWILSFFLLPFVGPVFYLLVGYSGLTRRRRKKPEPQKRLPDAGFLLKSTLGELEPRFWSTSVLSERLTGFPPVSGNQIAFFEGQETIYQALTQAIETATQSVYLEYYIFRDDSVGRQFRDLLCKKAREGLSVKVLLDHVGSFSLKASFLKPFQEAGVEVSFFGALTLKRPWAFQLRNHRKLAVIDRTKAFTGSQNICSDFKNWRLRKLDWVDVQFLIEGPAAQQLETVFLEDWEFTTGNKISSFTSPDLNSGNSIIQPLPTGPDGSPHAFEKILMSLIHSAQQRVTLLTPYFMPTEGIALSLEAATKRGVKVEILVPHKSDHWLVDAASKSWYWELLQGGIKLWETTESFIHAKHVTIDGEVALVGSANMDERSFRLNFECSLLVFDGDKVKTLESLFDRRVLQARQITQTNFKDQSFLGRVRDGLFRLVAPLL